MAKRNSLWANIDWLTTILYLALVIIGWINIYSAVYDPEHHSIFDVTQRYGKQMIWIGAALLIAFIILIIETDFYVFFAWYIYASVIILLILVLLIGTEINASKSWIVIGGFSLQPAEFGKFATALALSKYMSSYGFRFNSIKSLSIIAGIIMLPALLIFMQNDTGSAMVYGVFILVLYREGMSGVVLFFATLSALLFIFSLVLPPLTLLIILGALALVVFIIANQGYKQFFSILLILSSTFLLLAAINYFTGSQYTPENLLGGTLAIGGIAGFLYSYKKNIKSYMVICVVIVGAVVLSLSVNYAFENILAPYQQARINELLGIESDPLGIGYNVNQSKIAIGSGGFWGKGFLNGTQTKFNFVPEQSTDFIFCTVGEEWGFIGSSIIVLLFLLLFVRLILLAERQRSGFSRIYGYSVAAILFFHFLVNIGMTIGLMPVIGIPLPFFSYGGSSLWSFTILLFIFLRLDASRYDYLSS
ncbi:MAG TPA: rod shape-determining protein RodA [Mariniphaga sp.]|nr:rod shape-determining protein RodA [Mariniphaga sp.]